MLQAARDNPAELVQGRIDAKGHHLEVGRQRQASLLGRDDVAVFVKGLDHGFMDGTRDIRFIGREIVRMGEEVVRGVGGLGRNRLATTKLDATFAVAFFCALVGRRHAGVHQQGGRNGEVIDIPAVYLALPFFDSSGKRWRINVLGPARNAHAVVHALHLGAGRGVIAAAAQRGRVNEGQVREVEQVVANQQVVHVVVDVAIQTAPVGVVNPLGIGNQAGVGLGRIAHPDPDPAVTLHHGIGSDLGLRRNAFLAWRFNALALVAKLQAVIRAAHAVAFAAADR